MHNSPGCCSSILGGSCWCVCSPIASFFFFYNFIRPLISQLQHSTMPHFTKTVLQMWMKGLRSKRNRRNLNKQNVTMMQKYIYMLHWEVKTYFYWLKGKKLSCSYPYCLHYTYAFNKQLDSTSSRMFSLVLKVILQNLRCHSLMLR